MSATITPKTITSLATTKTFSPTRDFLTISILCGVYAIVFGQLLLFGELIKPITLFFHEKFLLDPVVNFDVKEHLVVDMAFTKVGMNLLSGATVILINGVLKRITSKSSNAGREAVIFLLSTLGLAAWDIGYLALGWEEPAWETFYFVSVFPIAIGGGFAMWGTFIIVKERILATPSEGWQWEERLILAIFAAAPQIYIIVIYANLHAYVQNPDTLNHFFLVYRTVGSFTLILAVIMFLMTCSDLCRNAFGAIRTDTKAEELKASKNLLPPITKRDVLGLIPFVCSKAIFLSIFFGSVLLFGNYISHVDGSTHAIDGAHTTMGYDSLSPPIESTVIRDAFLWMTGGALIGRLLLSLAVELPRLLGPRNRVWAFAVRIFANLVLLAVMVSWHVRTWDVTFASTWEIHVIAAFLGFACGILYFDAFIAVMTNYSQPSDVHTYMNEMRLIMIILLSMIILVCMRFATGFFGSLAPGGDPVVDYVAFTLILTILSAVSVGLDLFATLTMADIWSCF